MKETRTSSRAFFEGAHVARWGLGLGVIAAVLASTMTTACKREKKASAQAAAEMPPLASPPTTTLPIATFGDAVVSVPVGATRAQPVVVAVLGIGDTPEEQCTAWRDIVGARAFVLCPRGAPNMVQEEDVEPAPPTLGDPTAPAAASDDGDHDEGDRVVKKEDSNANGAPAAAREEKGTGTSSGNAGKEKEKESRARQVGFYPVDLPTVEREVNASLEALKKRFGGYVADREVVYAGFSRGAFLGASLVARHPERFSRAILIEGGQTPWQAENAAAFAKGGGKRILFACGQPSCVDDAEAAATRLREKKIETRVVHGAGEGHGYKKQVKDELRRSLDWVTEGDPAWPRDLIAR